MSCLGAIEQLGWPLDRIVHAEVWATDTIPADLPPMVEFKAKADAVIKKRWGIEVEHVRADTTYERSFFKPITKQAGGFEYRIGLNRGFPYQKGPWCQRDLKVAALNKVNAVKSGKSAVKYLGISADEPNRFGQLCEERKSPLVEAGWTEADCRRWCEENNLLSPIYTTASRGGCWFCHNQPVDQLRLLRKNYPEYWEMMLKWDKDSPVTFHPDGHTVHDFEDRFALEDMGFLRPGDRKFRWRMLKEDNLPVCQPKGATAAYGGYPPFHDRI